MIEKIIIISLLVYGVFTTMQPGMIFEKLGQWIEITLGEFWCKPVQCCPVCMAMWHGTIYYWLIWGLWLGTASIPEWVVVTVSSMGLNYILVRLFPED